MDRLDFALKPLCDYLSEEAKEIIHQRSRRRSFSDGQAVHARGDDSARVCIVANGAVRIGRFQHDGSFNLLSVLGPGAHYGDVAMQRQAYTQNAYAVGDCEIDMVDAGTLDHLLNNTPDFAIAIWHCNTSRLNALMELYDDSRTLGVTARLAKVIYVHLGRGELPNGVACLQRELAELLGVSLVSIGNALRELERADLVETGYRRVTVPSKARLKVWLRKSGAV